LGSPDAGEVDEGVGASEGEEVAEAVGEVVGEGPEVDVEPLVVSGFTLLFAWCVILIVIVVSENELVSPAKLLFCACTLDPDASASATAFSIEPGRVVVEEEVLAGIVAVEEDAVDDVVGVGDGVVVEAGGSEGAPSVSS